MNFLIIMCVFLTPAELLLVSEPSSANGEGETRPNRGKASSIKYLSLPSEQCARISNDIDKSEEEACKVHCKGLKKGFFDGECVDGTCHCKLDVTAIVSSSAEITRDKGKTGKRRGRHGVKCENLIRVKGQVGSENHKGCAIHCRLLSSDNKDGRCLEGVCECSRETIEEVNVVQREEEDGEGEEEDDGKCRNDEECKTGCNGLNREPSCMSGTCRCRILPPQQSPLDIPGIDREIKKCEHRRRAVSNEICRTHCEDFSRDHREGRCVDGVCRCGYAVFEIMDNTTAEEDFRANPEDKVLKKSRMSRKHSRTTSKPVTAVIN